MQVLAGSPFLSSLEYAYLAEEVNDPPSVTFQFTPTDMAVLRSLPSLQQISANIEYVPLME